jgi:hypothetical protein
VLKLVNFASFEGYDCGIDGVKKRFFNTFADGNEKVKPETES